MNVQTIALKKGKDAISHRVQQCLSYKQGVSLGNLRCLSTEQDISNASKAERAKEHVKDLSNKHKAQKQVKALEKDFFMSVLHSSTTKREAKSYIQRFDPSSISPQPPKVSLSPESAENHGGNGVNLGGFYGPAAVRTSPKFVQQPHKPKREPQSPQVHIALVKIRAPQNLNDRLMGGIGKTLAQLERLGLISIVIVDCESTSNVNCSGAVRRDLEQRQAVRIISAIEANGTTQARLVDSIVGVKESRPKSDQGDTETHITFPSLLMTPLRKGIIPIIPSLGYTETQKLVQVPGAEIVKAVTRELAGHNTFPQPDDDPFKVRDQLKSLHHEISVDKLIILDPLGGIPCSKQENGYHVFLNMEQEFEIAKQDLKENLPTTSANTNVESTKSSGTISTLGASNPFSKFVESEFRTLPARVPVEPKDVDHYLEKDYQHHLENLELARAFLARLPPSSSVLITSPDEAANLEKKVPFQAGVVGTRRQRNPLIHNLLTDRPAFSSSLPAGRVGSQLTANVTPTTIAKHGMSITILPNPRDGLWQAPAPDQPRLSLTDPQVDLPRLVHLIEDSFGRKLDVSEYLRRVNDRIAGIIIAGEYEGGAILTWELPPDVVDDGSPESRARMVPYLDKFAVLKKRQGSATADLVFKAMVRDCFPNGVCWRSRKDNVVNKWYFERSRGTWKLPDTGWTMFWTTPDLSMNKQIFLDYQSVCRSIQPSWADGKSILD